MWAKQQKEIESRDSYSQVIIHDEIEENEIDEEAFREIYDKYHLKVYNYIAKCINSREDALDLLQELFLLFYNRLPRLDITTGRIEAWLLRVARNMCLSYARNKYRRMTRTLADTEPIGDSNSETDLLKKDFRHKVHTFLNQLNDRERSVFILHKMEGLKYRELSQIFEVSERTLKRVIAGVLARMKDQHILEEDDLPA